MGIRDEILGGGGLSVEPFEYEGKTYYLREFSGTHREDFEIESHRRGDIEKSPDEFRGLRAFILVRSLCDEDGVLAFGTDETGLLADNINGRLLDALFDEVMRRNAMRGREVDELAGKSEDGPSGDSGID